MAKEKDIALTAVVVKYVSIRNGNLGVLNVVVKNYANTKFLNIGVSNVMAIQSVYMVNDVNGVKIVYTCYFVNIIIEKQRVKYVKQIGHVNTIKPVRFVLNVTRRIIAASIISINTFVEYVLIGLTVYMINTNHDVKNAEVHHYVNLRFATKWPSNATTIIVLRAVFTFVQKSKW